MLEIALASQSPRRRELLSQAGYDFHVFPVKVSEIIDENLTPAEAACQIAKTKVEACINQYNVLKEPRFLVVGADTMVVLGRRILGQPQNISEAEHFLRALSGKTHGVITGLYVLESGSARGSAKVWIGAEKTEVTFRILSQKEIVDYVATGEPMDKAGAYAIQGEGAKFVSMYQGSWSNVVGLPMERLEHEIKANGWDVRRTKA